MPRQYLYLLVMSTILFLVVLIFSFSVLVPAGKEYRVKRIDLKRATRELRKYENFHENALSELKNLQSDNRLIITAFDISFNPERFQKQNKKYFLDLKVSNSNFKNNEDAFCIYEVNTSSKINSPVSFYDFLDSINKSDWIMEINFPINFKREGDMIHSSFTMNVYLNNKETNASASESVER